MADRVHHSGESVHPENRQSDEQFDKTIFRVVRHERDYVQVANTTARDSRLSWEARGLLLYLLSLPANWTVRVAHLKEQGNAGRDAVRRMLRELQSFGYVSGFGQRERDAGGTFGVGAEIRVFESPTLNPAFFPENSPQTEKPSLVTPAPDRPSPEKPAPEKPSLYKVQNPQSTDLTKDTHTRGEAASSVCVSRPSRERIERYAANNRDYAGKLLGDGWVTKARKATGEDLEDLVARLEKWEREQETVSAPNPRLPQRGQQPGTSAASRQCPDCNGTGWQYPNGIGVGGVARCSHERLQTPATAGAA